MVCSTDILLSGSLSVLPPPAAAADILLYTVAAPLDYATAHGVAVTRAEEVENILYQPTIQELRYQKAGTLLYRTVPNVSRYGTIPGTYLPVPT